MQTFFQKPFVLVAVSLILGTAAGYLLRGDAPSQMAHSGLESEEAAFNAMEKQNIATPVAQATARSDETATEQATVKGDKDPVGKLTEEMQHLLDHPPPHVIDPNFFALSSSDPELEKLRQEAAADYVRSLQEAGAPEDMINQALQEYDVAMADQGDPSLAEVEPYEPTMDEQADSMAESLKESGMSEKNIEAQVENFRTMTKAEPTASSIGPVEAPDEGNGFGPDGMLPHPAPELDDAGIPIP